MPFYLNRSDTKEKHYKIVDKKHTYSSKRELVESHGLITSTSADVIPLSFLKQIFEANYTEVHELREKQMKDEAELLKLRRVYNIRSTLAEFEQQFTKCLEKTCEMNNENLKAVEKCIGSLYYTSSKALHGHDEIVVCEKD
ncbi:4037_t:CDS:2 [Scutellospora calospora]|uniref:4037_t:CDS:1 n=1 Tax=Scutellospora calospora TaxID=85575 RepID=A0ACA9JUJ5_9GLOM|nr:4037_t:CDS:2 [Scutellospora calospora]